MHSEPNKCQSPSALLSMSACTNGTDNHETSAITFFLRIIAWMRANY